MGGYQNRISLLWTGLTFQCQSKDDILRRKLIAMAIGEPFHHVPTAHKAEDLKLYLMAKINS